MQSWNWNLSWPDSTPLPPGFQPIHPSVHRKEDFQHLALKSGGFWGKGQGSFISIWVQSWEARQFSSHQLPCAQARSLLPILFPVPLAWLPALTPHEKQRHNSEQTTVLQDSNRDWGSVSKSGGVLQNTSHLTHQPCKRDRKGVIILILKMRK